MRRLRTEGSCSYSGRSVRRGGAESCRGPPAGPTGWPRSRRTGCCRPVWAKKAAHARIAQRAVEQSANVIGQKSAEAVVAAAVLRWRAEHEWSRRSRERLVAGVEPDRVSHARRRLAQPALHAVEPPLLPNLGVCSSFVNRPVRTRMQGGVGRAG